MICNWKLGKCAACFEGISKRQTLREAFQGIRNTLEVELLMLANIRLDPLLKFLLLRFLSAVIVTSNLHAAPIGHVGFLLLTSCIIWRSLSALSAAVRQRICFSILFLIDTNVHCLENAPFQKSWSAYSKTLCTCSHSGNLVIAFFNLIFLTLCAVNGLGLNLIQLWCIGLQFQTTQLSSVFQVLIRKHLVPLLLFLCQGGQLVGWDLVFGNLRS